MQRNTRAELPWLYYPKSNTVRVLNSQKPSGGGSPVIVQTKLTATETVADASHSFDAPVSAGNMVIVAIIATRNGRTYTVSGEDGAFAKDVSVLQGTFEISIHSQVISTSGQTEFNSLINVSSGTRDLLMLEVSGVSGLDAADSFESVVNVTEHKHSDLGINTSGPSLIISAAKANSLMGTITPNPSYDNSNESPLYGLYQWGIFDSAASNETGTFTSSTARAHGGAIAAYR